MNPVSKAEIDRCIERIASSWGGKKDVPKMHERAERIKQRLKTLRCWTRGYHQMQIEHISRIELGLGNESPLQDWYYLKTTCGCGAAVPEAREVLFRNHPGSLIETTWSSR